MRGFPPTYLNGPPAPNPHLAATYMANLNKAAAYAAAIQQNSTMPRHYSYQATSHEDLTAEGRMRVQPQPQPPPQTKDPYGHNIYAVSHFFNRQNLYYVIDYSSLLSSFVFFIYTECGCGIVFFRK